MMKRPQYPLCSYLVISGFLFTFITHSVAQVEPTKWQPVRSSSNCLIPPVINCPPNYNACPGSTTDPAVSSFATALPGSPECSMPILTYTDNLIDSSDCEGGKLIQRIWVATDPDDPFLRSFCVQYLNTMDTIVPEFINCPKDTTIFSNSKCTSFFSWDMPFVTDACGNFSVTSSHVNGSEFSTGTHQIEIVALDACFNVSSCSFQLEVINRCCPSITIICPPDFEGCPGSLLDPSVTGSPRIEKSDTLCKDPIISFTDKIIHSGVCNIEIERTWMARDSNDLQVLSTCTQIIRLHDTIKPNITLCPPNVTVTSNEKCTAIVTWPDPIAEDNCGSVQLTTTTPSGWEFWAGVSAVAVIATDACGNTSKCEFLVNVIDNCCKANPILICPADFTSCPNTQLDPSTTGTAIALPGDSLCVSPKLRFTDVYLKSTPCEKEITRTWKATDPNNNDLFTTCDQKITLIDTTDPVFSLCPADITVQTDTSCTATVNWNEAQATDACGDVTFSSSHASGTVFQIGQTTVTITVTDACGNTTICQFTITVIENCCQHPPSMDCPPDVTVCPNSDIHPSITGQATAVPGGLHCNPPIVSFRDDTISLSSCNSQINRTWVATDPQNTNLFTSCQQKIYLKDETPPVITFCPPNVTVQTDGSCLAEVNWSEPQATDNCGTVGIQTSIPSGWRFTIGTSGVSVIATDACGNTSNCEFLVTVEENCCNQAPVLHCPFDYFGCPGNSIDTSVTGSATVDLYNAICQQAILSFSDVVIDADPCHNVIHRTWRAVNPKNNSETSCLQVITLRDDARPQFLTCPPDLTIDPQYDCDTIISWVNPVIQDNCNAFGVVASHLPGDNFAKGTTRVVYTATDLCGNTSSCWFFITVTDRCCDRSPDLSCPRNYTACPGSSMDPSNTGSADATPATLHCLDPIISYTDRILTTGPCIGATRIERTWSAVDPQLSYLRSECTQIIDLKDTDPPVIQNMPANITMNAKGQCDAAVFWIHPVASDNCGLNSFNFNYRPGTRFKEGTTTVIYTAIDNCGLSTTDSFHITVTGVEVGIICPDDTTIVRTDPFINGVFFDWTTPKVKHCKPCKDFIPGFIYMGELDGHRYFCSTSPASWSNAKFICEQLGGKMAIINSQKENFYLASKLMGLTAWLGGTDEKTEGHFEWIDNTQLTYTSWLPGQPNNAGNNEDYIEMLPDGSWNDQDGIALREFICEIPCFDLQQIDGAPQGSLLPCGKNKITYTVNKDGKNDTCSFNITVDCEQESVYCKAKGLNSNYMFINRVEFAGIDTITGDNGGYHFFKQACGIINPGQTYPICVSPGYLSASYNVYWKVWIDFNADGFFDPVTEEVVYGFGNTTMCANLTMPPSLPSKATRMRISMSYSGYPASPCSSPLYGEVEDYCILMNGATQQSAENDTKQYGFKPVQLRCLGICDEEAINPLNGMGESDLTIRNNENPDAFEVELFPNPSNNKVSIFSRNHLLTDFEIYDPQGKMQLKTVNRKASNEFNFSVAELPNGIYTIVLHNTTGQQLIRRFMVNH